MAKSTEETPSPREINWEDPGTVMSSIWAIYRTWIFVFVGLLAGFLVIRKSYVTVPVGNKAVIMEFGHVVAVVPDGLHFTKPWITTAVLLSTRVQASNLKAEAVSRDTQKVMTEAVVNWSFKPDKLGETFESVGNEADMVESIMLPALNESLKAVTAKRPVADILDKREEIKEEIDEKFRKKLATYHVNVLDLYLTNLRFDDDYEKAIEAKQVAEVNVKTAENEANAARKKAQGEADSALIRAQGEAKSKRLLQSSVSPAVLQLEWIKAWEAGGSQVPQIITSNGNTPFMLDLKNLKGAVKVPAKTEEQPQEEQQQ